MANITIKEALIKTAQATKVYVDSKTSCLEDIDYDSLLAFDTEEIVSGVGAVSTASILGKAKLNRLILGDDGSN